MLNMLLFKITENMQKYAKCFSNKATTKKPKSHHNQIIDDLTAAAERKLSAHIEEATFVNSCPTKQNKDKHLEATENMFRTVYVEAALNIPLFQHHRVVEFFRASELNIGPALYFYKLMELGIEEDSDAYLEMLKHSF